MSDYGALLDLDERTDRAKDVIDGFKCPTERLAYDVMRLAQTIRCQDAEIIRLKRLFDDLMDIFGIKK